MQIRKKTIKILLILLLNLLIGFAVSEIVLRIYFKPLPSEGHLYYLDWNRDVKIPPLLPNAEAIEVGALIKTNSHGQRGPEYSIEKPENVYRILIFGNSYVHGTGVPLEDTIPWLLNLKLNEIFEDSIEVINFGSNNMNTFKEYMYFMNYAPQLNPDMVINIWINIDIYPLGYTLDDFNYFVEHSKLEKKSKVAGSIPEREESNLLSVNRFIETLRSNSLTIWLAGFTIKKWLIVYGINPEVTETLIYQDEDSDNFILMRSSLQKFRDNCSKMSCDFSVVLYPGLNYLNSDYFNNLIYKNIERICEKDSIRVLNLFDTFKGKKPADLQVHRTDAHPNGYANRLAVESISDFLLPRIVTQKDSLVETESF